MGTNVTIKDAAGNSSSLTLPATTAAGSLGTNKAIVVDGIAPTVTSVSSSTANGTYQIGSLISIQVSFSEVVNVVGIPTLALNAGGSASATYLSGTGSTVLNFSYTVAAGQSVADLNYSATTSLAVGSGVTIQDAAGNAASLTLPTTTAAGSLGANKAMVVDGIAPTVTSVSSSTGNGTYRIGNVISIQVTLSEAVSVVGSPTLVLNAGGSASAT